jgi:cytochrome c oxidase subunit 3
VPVEVSTVAPAAEGPEGMRPDALEAHATHDSHLHDSAHVVHPLQDPHRPANAHMFFNIYFMMTGLHGIHVIIGGAVIVWLLVLSLRGRFSPAYFTPVDLGGLYWHVVDLIWIFLFPLFYLI